MNEPTGSLAAMTPEGDLHSGGTADAPVPLGKLAVDRGLITQLQLAEAFSEQLATGRRLGEILCARGFLSEHDLEELLAAQRETRIEVAPPPEQPAAAAWDGGGGEEQEYEDDHPNGNGDGDGEGPHVAELVAPAEEAPAVPAFDSFSFGAEQPANGDGTAGGIGTLIEEIERQAAPLVDARARYAEVEARAEEADKLLEQRQQALKASALQVSDVTAQLEEARQELASTRAAHGELERMLGELQSAADRRAREEDEYRQKLERLKALLAEAAG